MRRVNHFSLILLAGTVFGGCGPEVEVPMSQERQGGPEVAFTTVEQSLSCSSSALVWSYDGAPAGMRYCTLINEPSDPAPWFDNFLCSNINFGFKWSTAGAIPGMNCTQIIEPADPHTWDDNYLCVPSNSPLNLSWSFAGPIPNKECILVNEPADPHAWNDNYLCY